MKPEIALLARKDSEKALAALAVLRASLEAYTTFDPSRAYTPKELEPYDAMCDRFIRGVESCIRFFRSYEPLQFGERSETFRDLLNRMHKLGLISSVIFWIEMRDVRNRIVHDYLPGQRAALFADIVGPFGHEIMALRQFLESLEISEDRG